MRNKQWDHQILRRLEKAHRQCHFESSFRLNFEPILATTKNRDIGYENF